MIFKKVGQFSFILVLVLVWVFSSYIQIFNFPPDIKKAEAFATITQVGSALTGVIPDDATADIAIDVDLTSLGLIAGDFVVVLTAWDSGSARDGIDGNLQSYTRFGSTSTDPDYFAGYKIMGHSPDTVVTLGQQASNPGPYLIQAWRGVDPNNILDVAKPDAATRGSGAPDSPAINPSTAGSLVLSLGFLDDDDGIVDSYPSGYSAGAYSNSGQSSTSGGTTVMIASKTWSSGTENPGAFSLSTGDDGWTAETLALRPAPNPNIDQVNFQFFETSASLPSYSSVKTITQVGSTLTGGISTGSSTQTVSLTGLGLAEGDIVIALTAFDELESGDGLSGNTEGYVIYGGIDDGVDQSPGYFWGYKIMGSTPDTAVTLGQNGSFPGAYLVQAWRNVDPSFIFDVSKPRPELGTSGGPDAPPITPVTAGSLIVAMGFLDDDDGEVDGYPSGYSSGAYANTGLGGTSSRAMVTIASKIWSSGEDNPSAFSLSTGSDDTRAETIALRPLFETPSGRMAVDTAGADVSLDVDTDYGWQFRLENTGGVAGTGYKVQYKHIEGTNTWTDISGSSDVVVANLTSDFANGADVPEFIRGSGYYLSNNNAGLESTGTLTLGTSLPSGFSFEGHINFQIVSSDVDVGDTIQLRVVYGTGTELESYTDTPTITVTGPLSFEQEAFRFFNNADSTDVGSPLQAQNTNATLASAGDAFRLRMLMHIDGQTLTQNGQSFKLAFGTSCASLSEVTGATAIAFSTANSPSDGTALTSNANDPNAGHLVVNQDYEEANNFTNSEAAISAGSDGQWDFSLIDNGAPAGTEYCFRILKSDDSPLDTYTVDPKITTALSEVQTLTFSISDNSVEFGTLASGDDFFADTSGGNATEVEAHTITASTNASDGYIITLNGTTLTSGEDTISAIGSTNTASNPGTEQFGLRMTASGGDGTVSAPYADSGFAFDINNFPDEVASDANGDDVATTYSVRYLGNISADTSAGSYSAVLTYIITAGF